jgi:Cof subfamily protein (haloacid dehalogenase superfamily)
MSGPGMAPPTAGSNADIRLVVSDIDGTIIRHDKVLTDRSVEAVGKLREAGIRFTVVSSRPPKGILSLIKRLKVDEPFGAFNGALIVKPDAELTTLFSKFLDSTVSSKIIALISSFGIDPWLYTDKDWFVPDRHGWHVDHEVGAVNFEPFATKNFDAHVARVGKIVAVSTDESKMAPCEAAIREQFAGQVSATRSQPYYIDITDPAANKGDALIKLSHLLNLRTSQIVTVGDAAPDVLMFKQSGMSIAVANANPEVQQSATFVTTSNDDEGFANAIERFVLNKASARAESSR